MNNKEQKTLQLEEELKKKASQAEKKAEKKAARAEKKAKKKAVRSEKKAKKKEKYRNLDRKGKILHWVKRVSVVLVAAAVTGAFLLFYGQKIFIAALLEFRDACLEQKASLEEILKIAPLDERGDALIARTKSYDEDDTWAIYVYVCGSNLESNEIVELSDLTRALVAGEAEAYKEEAKTVRRARLATFASEISSQGLDFPAFMYLPVKQVEEQEEEGASEYTPCATNDIEEMLAVALPDNIKVVYQTGGATSWGKTGINPNRSQRFVYDSKGFREVENNVPQNTGDAKTLSDFLKFCKKNYSADHEMLIFWDHGGGAFGFGADELYGHDGLTLKEIREALASAHGSNPSKPPYEIIGFDACLMASLEVAESLNGYGQYLVGSEELEPGDGWDYTTWADKLVQNPGMNAAQVGKAIADSYIEYYANQSAVLSWMNIENMCTFSVVDIPKAHEVYEAYGEFAAAALKDAMKDPGVLTQLGRAANGSVRYGCNVYNYYNTVDLGVFMENLAEEYPSETQKVQMTLEDAVLYRRATSYGKESKGLSVYFPTDIDDVYGLHKYLEYMDEVCDNQDINALYYYKFAGCLNDELQAYADEKGYGKARVLDTTPLKNMANAVPKLDGNGNFSVPVDEEQETLIQSMTLDLFRMDEDDGKAVYYGGDNFLSFDGEGNIQTSFDGEWVSIDGHFLMVEKVDETESSIRYRAAVSYNGVDSYLLLGYDFETEEMSIAGVVDMYPNSDVEADTVNRITRNVEPGAKIRPIYYTNGMDEDSYTIEYGKAFRYKGNTKLEDRFLDDGDYVEFITFKDTRGDEYYTPAVRFTVRGGRITDMNVADDIQVITTAD